MTRTIMRVATAGFLLSSGAGAALAISRGEAWNVPGWDLHFSSVTTDFLIGGGTAMSGSLVMLVALAVLVLFATSQIRGSRAALWVVAGAGVWAPVGQLIEPFAREVLAAPGSDTLAALIVVGNIVFRSRSASQPRYSSVMNNEEQVNSP